MNYEFQTSIGTWYTYLNNNTIPTPKIVRCKIIIYEHIILHINQLQN